MPRVKWTAAKETAVCDWVRIILSMLKHIKLSGNSLEQKLPTILSLWRWSVAETIHQRWVLAWSGLRRSTGIWLWQSFNCTFFKCCEAYVICIRSVCGRMQHCVHSIKIRVLIKRPKCVAHIGSQLLPVRNFLNSRHTNTVCFLVVAFGCLKEDFDDDANTSECSAVRTTDDQLISLIYVVNDSESHTLHRERINL